MSQMVILVGLPGAGKSTYSKKHFPNHFRINQDEMGSRDACAMQAKNYIELGKDIIIDRVNFDRRQRQVWLNLAKFYGVTEVVCVYLKVPKHICLNRIEDRKDHPTIHENMPLDKKRQIVYTFAKKFEEPSLDEGFAKITVVDNFDPDEYGVCMA